MKPCDLCGDRRTTSTALAWFIDGGPMTIDRCRDHDACRARVEATGEEWPLESSEEARRRRARDIPT